MGRRWECAVRERVSGIMRLARRRTTNKARGWDKRLIGGRVLSASLVPVSPPAGWVPEVSHCARVGTHYYPEVPGALRVTAGKGIMWDTNVIERAAWPEV